MYEPLLGLLPPGKKHSLGITAGSQDPLISESEGHGPEALLDEAEELLLASALNIDGVSVLTRAL